MVANSMVLHLKRLDRHIPALAIASAINERLTDLMAGARLLDSVTSGNAQRFHMFSEAVRRQTFEQWPHMDYKWALPDQMAQAGFYHQPSVTGDDRAMCFTCSVCLVCWEKTDEPWSEHERHSPGCPFVKGEYTQNVPLAITYATSPALKNSSDEFTIVSNGNQGNLICTGNKTGQITIWNIERQLKSCHVFQISDKDKLLASKLSHISVDFNLKLDAICTYKVDDCQIGAASSLANQKSISMSMKNKMIGTKIVCGISIPGFENNEVLKDLNENSNMVIEMNIQNHALNLQHGVPAQELKNNLIIDNSNIYLIIYEIVETSDDKIGPISTKTLLKEDNENKQLITNSSDAKKSSVKNIVPEDRYDDVYMKFLPTEIDTMYESWKIGDLHVNETIYVHPTKLSDIDFKGFFTDSDHIDDEKDKQNKNITKPDVGDSSTTNLIKFDNSTNDIKCKVIQCISISPYNSYEITDIIPTCDKKYLLIVLRNNSILNTKDETAMEINDDEIMECSKRVKLILYEIKDDGLLNEFPICSRLLDESETPLEFCMLPTHDNNGRNLSENNQSGVFVMVCSDGSLKMITVTTLKTVSEAKIDNEKFVSAIYCKSLERLCGCTETGSLHFYSFYDLDADSGDDREEDVYIPQNDNSMICGDHEMLEIDESHQEIPICDNISTSSQTNLPSTPSANVTILAYKPEINLNDLKLLHTLTQFDEMLTSYSAEVPGCWSELVQAHKQRRHPQQMRPGDDMHLTKTWRLHNDA